MSEADLRKVCIVSWAKVNLSLRVLGHRPDGYHEIHTTLQSISVGDVIEVVLAPKGPREVVFQGAQGDETWTSRLLVLIDRALERLGWSGRGILVTIEKKIPICAGLGGSSADGAGLLRALILLSGREKDLAELAPEFGSDIPGMLVGGQTLCQGRGERIAQRRMRSVEWYVVLIPPVQCDTRMMYQALGHPHRGMGREEEQEKNDFEPLARGAYPEVNEAFEALLDAGASRVHLSGSGSGVFAEAGGSRENAIVWLERTREQTGFPGFVCHSMASGHGLIFDGWGVAKR